MIVYLQINDDPHRINVLTHSEKIKLNWKNITQTQTQTPGSSNTYRETKN